MLPFADEARKYYDLLTNKQNCAFSPTLSAISFNGYMKTGFVMIQADISEEKLIKAVKKMMNPFMKRCFDSWIAYTQESLVYKSTREGIFNLAECRHNFGPLYWTYHVWKRWSRYRRARKKGMQTTAVYSYLPEWNFFLARKTQRKRLDAKADEMRRKNIIHRTNKALHSFTMKMLSSSMNISEIQKKVNAVTMWKAYRALITNLSFKKLKSGTQRRVIRFWYRHIDAEKKNRMCLEIFQQRRVLSTLNEAFRNWRLNIIEEGAFCAYLHEKVKTQKPFILKFGYLLAGDFVHYTQITALHEWKKIIAKKKKAKRFMSWSLNFSKTDAIKHFILDCFKIKADRPVDMMNYNPFIINSRQQVKKKKFFDIASKKKVSFDPFVNCVSAACNAAKNSEQYDMCTKDISEWTSDETKNLFLQLVYLVSKFKTANKKSQQQILKDIRNFRITNMLFNQAGVAELLCKQNAEDAQARKIIQMRDERDRGFILAMETHEAAVKLNEVNPKFRLGLDWEPKNKPKPKKRKGKKGKKKKVEEKKEEKQPEEEENENEEDVPEFTFNKEVQNKFAIRRHSIRPKTDNPPHPLLAPIEKIRADLMQDIRKFRRNPNEIFIDHVQHRNINTRQLVSSASNLSLSRQSSTYESFIPIDLKAKTKPINTLVDIPSPELSVIKEDGDNEELIKPKHEKEKVLEVVKPKISFPTSKTTQKRFEQSTKVSSTIKTRAIKFGPEKNKIVEQPVEKEKEEVVVPKPKKKEQEKPVKLDTRISKIQENLSFDTSIEKLASSFINDESFQKRDRNSDFGYLTQKYFFLLDTLLGKKNKVPHIEVTQHNVQDMVQEFPQVTTRITKLIRRLNRHESKRYVDKAPPPIKITAGEQQLKERKEKKQQRMGVFDTKNDNFETVQSLDGKEYKVSQCPEFANVYFTGDQMLTNAPWESHVAKRTVESNEPYVSLQSPTFTVSGFENIPGFSALATQVAQYFDANEEEDEGKAIPQEHIVSNFHEFMNEIAKKYLNKELDNMPSENIETLVDTTDIVINQHDSKETKPKAKEESPKKQFFITKSREFSHKAFETTSRRVKTPKIIEDKFTFTAELLRAIKEGSEIMREHTKRYMRNKSRPFDGLAELRKRIMERQQEVNKQKSPDLYAPPLTSRKVGVKSLKELEDQNGEVSLTVGGKQKREIPHQARPATSVAFTRVRRVPRDESRDFVVTSRAKTSMRSTTSSFSAFPTSRTMPEEKIPNLTIAQLDTTKMSIRVHEAAVGKRKPQFTKMTPTAPRKPETLVYETPAVPRLARTSRSRESHWQVDIEREKVVTDEDVDFLLFVTPYIIPPELLTKLLDETE